jgi:hypothetical protein
MIRMNTLAVVAALLLAGCGKISGTDSATQTGVDAGTPYTGPVVTYYKDVQPLVAANCQGCHSADGIGPFDLSNYDAMKAHGAVAAAAVSARIMPPWMPSEAGRPLIGSRRLTDDQITLVKNWVAQGMPAGDPADATHVDPPVSTFRTDAAFPMATPYSPNTSLGTDDYHCFVIDPQLDADKAVTAFNVLPGDKRVVHHVILFGVEKADQPQLADLQAHGDGHGGYTCFGSSGINSAIMVGGWVPGTSATTFPAGTGVVLSAGSKIVMQVHYNMLQVQQTTDNTKAMLQYAPAASVKKAYIIPILNQSFSVPAGKVDTVLAVGQDVPAGLKLQIWGLLPHMHLHGTNVNVVATMKNGTKETLIDIPRWDFHWQQLYFFQQPLEVQPGDRATLSCTFDNTQANQPIVNGEQVPARTLRWGEDTLSEMCLSYLYATVK